MTTDPGSVLDLDHVSVMRDGRAILDDLSWRVLAGQRWIVMGRNGCGKTTLLRVASLYLHPSHGTVTVLGELLGRTDVRLLRKRIGVASAALTDQLRPALSAADVVMTAKNAALEPWWHTYDEGDRTAALACLQRLGVAGLAPRSFGTLSSGERQRVLLARTLMTDPALLLFDEPTAGLDLGGREEFVAAMASLAADPLAPPIVSVTHHVEEVPPGFTHVLLMKNGRALAQGPLAELFDAEHLSECFEVALNLDQVDHRWYARAR